VEEEDRESHVVAATIDNLAAVVGVVVVVVAAIVVGTIAEIKCLNKSYWNSNAYCNLWNR
jgi:hypothetical protein